MAIYVIELILILLLGALYYSKTINKKTFIVLAFTIMALVLGLRAPSVGEDTQHFIDIFYYASNISWGKVLTSGFDTVYNTVWGIDLSIETGYLLMNKVIGIFTDEGQWLIFVVAVFTCWLFAKFILDNCEGVFLPTYIFMCESLYMSAFNLMRYMLALAIAIQSYKFIRKKEYIKAVLIIILAFTFHKTALLMLVLIPLQMVKKKQRCTKYVFISCVAMVFSVPLISKIVSYFIPRYASYFVRNYWESTLGFGSIMLLIVELIICIFTYYRKIKDSNEAEFTAVSCTVASIAFEVIGIRIVVFERIAMMFKVFLLFLFPDATGFFQKRPRLVYYFAVLIVLAVSFLSYASTDARAYSFCFWQ